MNVSFLQKLNATQIGVILVAVPLAAQLIVIFWLGAIMQSAGRDFAQLEHEKLVLLEMHKMGTIAAEALLPVVRLDRENGPKSLVKLELFQAGLRHPTRSGLLDPKQYPELMPALERVFGMQHQIDSLIVCYKTFLNHPEMDDNDFRSQTRKSFLGLAIEFDDLGRQILNKEHEIDYKAPAEFDSVKHSIETSIFAFTIINILSAVLLAEFFSRTLVRRLETIADNAAMLAVDKPLQSLPLGNDELGELNRALWQASNLIAQFKQRELAIVHNSADVICSLDKNLRIASVGDSVSRIWRIDASSVTGKYLLSMVSPKWAAKMRLDFEGIIASESKEGQLEFPLRCGDGVERIFQWSVHWSPAEHTFFCVVHDVSQQREIEEIKQRFISVVSHDLRAPLSAIGVSLALIASGKRGELSKSVAEEIQKVETCASKLGELANDLVELDKIESGKLVMEIGEVQAYNICANAKESLQRTAETAGVALTGPDRGAIVSGDEHRLVPVVMHLIANAIKSSSNGSVVRLAISYEDGWVKFSVSDDGPGLTEQEQELVFEKFAQQRSQSHLPGASASIGLAVVKAIVHAHGGTFGVTSAPGKGSTFWFKLKGTPGEDEEL